MVTTGKIQPPRTSPFGTDSPDIRHCAAPRSTLSLASITTIPTRSVVTAVPTLSVSHSHDSHDHDHEHVDGIDAEHVSNHSIHAEDDHHSSGGSVKPSPTESAGCENHGNHWHCDGKKAEETAAKTGSAGAASTSSSSSGSCQTGVNKAAMVGVMGLAVAYTIMS